MDNSERVVLYRLHAEFCKTLSDANRLLIISELARGEASVTQLAQRLGLGQSNLSKHLGILRDRGLVITRREGGFTYYTLSDPRISEAIRLLREVQADQLARQHLIAGGISQD